MKKALPVAVLCLALAGCGVVQPTTSASPSFSESPSPSISETIPLPIPTDTALDEGTTSGEASASPTPTVETPTPTSTPTVSATPTTPVELSGTGLAGYKFGGAEEEVQAGLVALLGTPDSEDYGVTCELDSESPWSHWVVWGGLSVLYTAKNQKQNAPRTLAQWSFNLTHTLAPPLYLADNMPTNLTLKELKKQYPKGKLEDTGLGDDSAIFTAPNKLRFFGDNVPDTVQAGQLIYCE
ncbi:MAG: hypothetical protein LBR20_07600 [Propionibacteriaceae bacterium]|jgi:hypothetical protein|nr:hypothetical protein [Propionibacteriaceae bacterium]